MNVTESPSYPGFWGRNRNAVLAAMLVALSICVAAEAKAQVTIKANGWAHTFSFATAVAGSEPATQSNAQTTLSYGAVGAGIVGKITVNASGSGTWHSMSVVATNLTSTKGTPGVAQTVTLTNGGTFDFITGISANAKNCFGNIQYTSSPLFSEGSGTCTYSVTYTLTQ
jgi:hypothetical protein